MRNSRKLLLGIAIFILVVGIIYFPGDVSRHSEGKAEVKEKLSGAARQLNSWWWGRALPDPYFINTKYMAAWDHAVKMKNSKDQITNSRTMAGFWTSLGPRTLGGRMLSLAINPLKHTTLFAGSASGGIWKSYTGGVGTDAWQPVTTGFPVLGVSSIIYHPSDTNIIYAGTGEIYRVDSTSGTPNPGNTGYNVWKTRGTYSVGLLRSTNAGTTWTQVFTRNFADLFGIQKIKFDPNNSNIVFICGTDGLYKYDSSTGITTPILTLTYISDIWINPSNSNQIIVGVGNLGNSVKGIYRTTDGGTTWINITSGLPASNQGYIKFDHHAGSNTIYASIGVSSSSSTEVYRSTDAGLNWTGISNTGHSQWQYWFAHTVAVDPNNVNMIFACGAQTKKRVSISGSSGTAGTFGSGNATMNTYIPLGGQEGPSNYLHDDIHDLEYVPNRSDSLYFLTDGGIFLSTNANTATVSNITLQSCNSGLVTAQFYGPVAQSQTDATFFLSGLQDNNTAVYNGSTGLWKRVVSGDGGPSQIKPDNDDIVLSSRDARAVYRSTDRTGSYSLVANYWGSVADSRTGFMAPLVWSQANPDKVYLASDNLHVSTDAGASFSNNSYSTATNYIEMQRKPAIAMAVAPNNENIVFISTSPFAQYDNDNDNIYVNSPANFMKTSTGNTPFTSIYGGGLPTPNRYIMDIAIHPTNSNIVWVALGGFGSGHIYQSADGGSTWTDKSGSGATALPDVPTNAVMIDPTNSNIIYAGNDLGVYVSPNAGANWYDFNGNLWDATQIVDLVPVPGSKIRAATHGKGLFESVLYSGTLPVVLGSFTGVNKGSYNELKWIVSQEDNLLHYVLEKSTDGRNFQVLETVPSRNSFIETIYVENDVIGTASSVNYYRLKMVNQDGSFTYSGIVQIRKHGKSNYTVVGNPFTDRIIIQYTLTVTRNLEACIYDTKGRLISATGLDGALGNGSLVLENLGSLSRGTYILRVHDGARPWSLRLVK